MDGWLDARPKEGGDITNRQRLSIKGSADDILPEVPETALYVLELFFDLGPVMVDSMGRRPIGYDDLRVWALMVGPELHPWEATTLVSMSHLYMLGLQGGEKGEPMPSYHIDEDMRQSVADKIKMAFSRRVKKPAGAKRKKR